MDRCLLDCNEIDCIYTWRIIAMRFLVTLILFFSILSVDASTSFKAISVNFFNQPGNNEEINQYGAPSYSTVDGWINTTDGNIALLCMP